MSIPCCTMKRSKAILQGDKFESYYLWITTLKPTTVDGTYDHYFPVTEQ